MRIRYAVGLVAAVLLAACADPQAPPRQRPSGDSPPPASTNPSTAASTTTATTGSTTPALTRGGAAWVSVSVATLWRTPAAPRSVDAPALANPARIGEWLAAMTTDQRRALNGRADTQALLGDKVVVLRLRPRWVKVAVPDQPTPGNSRGYPGWVPRRQLTATPPAAAEKHASVVDRLTWLRVDQPGGARVLRVSYGTRLPVLGRVGDWVRVATPAGDVRRVRATAVSVHRPGSPALPGTRAGVVASARTFLGLDYLWAGRSGFGFDCSGLTSLVYRVHGVRLPRDAAPQSRAGRHAASLRAGDLMFFADSGGVHHVSMYVGGGSMLHSPHTGATVSIIDIDTAPYAQEYVGARRFLG